MRHHTENLVSFFTDLNEVYKSLCDDLSRRIFLKRISHNITGDLKEVGILVQDASASILQEIQTHGQTVFDLTIKEEDTVVLYGLGHIGRRMIHELNLMGRPNSFLCDQNWESLQEGYALPVISPQALIKTYKHAKIVVCAAYHFKEVYTFLQDNGVPKEHIYLGSVNDSAGQYFDEIIQFGEDEIFVDAGAFCGETSLEFAKRCPNYSKIVIFEPDASNVSNIHKNMKIAGLHRCQIIAKGVWSENTVLKFNNNIADGCHIDADGATQLNVTSIDSLLLNEGASFIKMDIEGSEQEALEGARGVIQKFKPKLAISVYHKPQDIVSILQYLKHLVPEYTFYLRHYSMYVDDTVLYAITRP